MAKISTLSSGEKSLIKNNLPQKNTVPWFTIGLWSIVGTILGYFFWGIVGYGQQLFRQPFLLPAAIPKEAENLGAIEDKALLIASANLRAGIEKRHLLNGQEHGTLALPALVSLSLTNFKLPKRLWKCFSLTSNHQASSRLRFTQPAY